MRYELDPSVSIYAQLPEDHALRPMAARVGSAVYRFFDADGVLLYVGISSRPRDRWYAHSRKAEWWPLVSSATVSDERYGEPKARFLECQAIGEERPRFNVAMSLSPPGVLPEPSLSPPIGKGREGKGIGYVVLHSALTTGGTLPRRPATLTGPMQDKT